MAQTQLKNKTHTEVEDGSSLKGTLASVFFVGIFIVLTWVGVYFLYLDRF
ncbi:subunit I/II of b(o/a)3-type cytochrome C oxidase [Bacillus dakarensis]|nr:subunit I/II of b(o/a)3-type cytochrome C oxidase [Bacillus dakarensis]